MKYEWVTYGHSIRIEDGPKIYGAVRLRSGRVIYRNYHRVLKNGNGVSFAFLFAQRIKASEEHLRASLQT